MNRSAVRRLRSRFMVGLMGLAVVLAVLPLLLILGTLIAKGAGSLNLAFFTNVPVPAGETGGGVLHAIIGTLMIVGSSSSSARSSPRGRAASTWPSSRTCPCRPARPAAASCTPSSARS